MDRVLFLQPDDYADLELSGSGGLKAPVRLLSKWLLVFGLVKSTIDQWVNTTLKKTGPITRLWQKYRQIAAGLLK